MTFGNFFKRRESGNGILSWVPFKRVSCSQQPSSALPHMFAATMSGDNKADLSIDFNRSGKDGI